MKKKFQNGIGPNAILDNKFIHSNSFLYFLLGYVGLIVLLYVLNFHDLKDALMMLGVSLFFGLLLHIAVVNKAIMFRRFAPLKKEKHPITYRSMFVLLMLGAIFVWFETARIFSRLFT